jgi:hypothetical protein
MKQMRKITFAAAALVVAAGNFAASLGYFV